MADAVVKALAMGMAVLEGAEKVLADSRAKVMAATVVAAAVVAAAVVAAVKMAVKAAEAAVVTKVAQQDERSAR